MGMASEIDDSNSDDSNLIQDGTFQGCLRMRMGQKGSPSKNLSHKSHNGETWHSYTLPKGDTKYI